MIIGFLLGLVYWLVYGLFAVLPSGTDFSATVLEGFGVFGSFLYAWNAILPVSELLNVMSYTITLLVFVFAVRIILYVAALVRGNSVPGQS